LSTPSLAVGGVDDGYFERGWRRALLALSVLEKRGGSVCPRELRVGRVTVDGLDATDTLLGLLDGLELGAVFLDNVVVAGFNLLEPWRVTREARVPAVVVLRYPPRREAVARALRRHFPDWELRLSILERVWSGLRWAPCPRGGLLVAAYGVGWEWAAGLVCGLQVYTRVPEPLYLAHTAASGLTRSLGPELLGLK